MGFTFDHSLAMKSHVRGGVRGTTLDALAPNATEAFLQTQKRVANDELGFWQLPDQELAEVEALVKIIQKKYTDIVWCGIGGSSLGTKALLEACVGPLAYPQKDSPRFHFPDNVDPWLVKRLQEQLPKKTTLLVVVSKSGGTLETAALMLSFSEWLGKNWKKQCVFVTDPEKGILREKILDEDVLATFPVPSNVGGRFSVLTAIGTLPLAIAGGDPNTLLAGARAMRESCTHESLSENPALHYALIHHTLHCARGRDQHVLMPYADALRPFSQWFVQLWAESLGKKTRDRKKTPVGPTPIASIGASDQHAQMQLMMEGTDNKIVTFLRVKNQANDLKLANTLSDDYAYLDGQSMHSILEAELNATRSALANYGRPSVTLSVDDTSEKELGSLFFFFEAATAFAGELYNVNAFDQPGVELSKVLSNGLLNKPGFEEQKEKAERFLVEDPATCMHVSYT